VLRNSSVNNQKLQVTPLDVAFVQLRGLLPTFLHQTENGHRMGKVDIIRQTLRYIVMLRQILEKQQQEKARQQDEN